MPISLLTGSFNAVGESGRTYTLHEWVDKIDAGTLSDPNATLDGLKRIVTDDRGPVNFLEKGKYKLVMTGEILRFTDPDAP
jgi:hypothetical protein